MFNPTHYLTYNPHHVIYEIEYSEHKSKYRLMGKTNWEPTTIQTSAIKALCNSGTWSLELIEPEFEGN